MKAWLLDKQTGLDGLRLDESVPDPEPGEGEVLLEVHYAALNPADYYLAEKRYPAKPSLPHILGRDAMAAVHRNGAGASIFPPGDRVAILRGEAGVTKPGTLAERVSVPEDLLVAIPDGWSEQQAAGAPLVYLTAYMALTQWGPIEEGATILVTGATGGVGIASSQLAKAMGHRVVGLTRSAEKGREIEKLGVDLTLNPGDPDLVKKVREFAGKPGVKLAVDSIAGELFAKLIATLGYMGYVSCVGRLAGPVPEFNTGTIFFRRQRIGGVSVGDYSAKEARDAWSDILGLLGRSGQKPIVDSVYPFEQLKEAFGRLKEGPLGKVLVQVKK